MTSPLPTTTRAVTVRSTPVAAPLASDFEVTEVPLAAPAEGEVLVRVDVLSLDPYLRSLLGPGHLGEPAVGPGQVMAGSSIGTVIASESSERPVGTRVLAETGWRAEAVVAASATTALQIPEGVADSAMLGALGMPGLTAYAAVERHLRPASGDTVVISSATGGVGALAGQLARLTGARTVAIVGSDDKARFATDELGYDAAVVRGREGWVEALHAACPDRISCYLHMGDQDTLDATVEHLALGARVSLVGLMDQTNGAAPTRIRAGALMAARATTYGMVVYDHTDLAAAHRERVAALLTSAQIVAPEDRRVGLDNTPAAFADLMAGRNHGKVIVQVS